MNKLIDFKDKKLIKVITGIRRCGKSTLMEMFRDWLKEHGTDEKQITFVNFEDYDFFELRDPRELYAFVKTRLVTDKMNYLFFDEIQHVANFPDVINSLNIKANTDIYLTGSNAYMLATDIATLLSGRYVEIPMLPLSFSEYVRATGNEGDLQKAYNAYTTGSSFPYTLELHGRQEITDYLSGVYNTIVVKDIMTRKKIQDATMLESVIRFAADNIGNITSVKRMADTMTSEGRRIDPKTVEKYLYALCETFFLYEAKRFNIKGRQLLKSLNKYYLVDIGLRRMLLGSRTLDAGRILENEVFLELLYRRKRVYVGKSDQLEVDFVAMDGDGMEYFQVAATVRDPQTLKRELAPLQQIADQYPKTILTLDPDPAADFDGIKVENALEWMMKTTSGQSPK